MRGLWQAFGDNEYYYGWVARVVGISGTTVTLSHAPPRSFVANAFTQFKTMKNIELKNLTLDARGRTDGTGISFDWVYNSRITNVTVLGTPVQATTGSLHQGIHLGGAVSSIIDGCKVDGGIMKFAGTGEYAIAPNGQDVTVSNSVVSNFSSGIIGASMRFFSTGFKFINNRVLSHGQGTMMNFHGSGSGIMKGNTLNGTGTAQDGICVRWTTRSSRTTRSTSTTSKGRTSTRSPFTTTSPTTCRSGTTGSTSPAARPAARPARCTSRARGTRPSASFAT